MLIQAEREPSAAKHGAWNETPRLSRPAGYRRRLAAAAERAATGRAHASDRHHGPHHGTRSGNTGSPDGVPPGPRQLGWKEGHNIRFEYRWPAGDTELIKTHAAELVAAAPDLILTGLTNGVQALKRETRTIPIVFANVADPVGSGLVPSLAKPGGNVTGFTAVEYAIVGKWLELLKEIAPGVERVALASGNPRRRLSPSQLRRQLAGGRAVVRGRSRVAAEVRNAADIERAIEAFAREPNGG